MSFASYINSSKWLKKKKKRLIYLFLASLGLWFYAWAVSSCGGWDAWASHGDGPSYWGVAAATANRVDGKKQFHHILWHRNSTKCRVVKNPPAMWEIWVGKNSWRREQLPTPVLWPGEFHGLYNPRGSKVSDMTEQLSLSISGLCLETCF